LRFGEGIGIVRGPATYSHLLVLGLRNFHAEVSCWTLTGERQSSRLRVKYLQALLQQDVAYFDTDASTGALVNSLAIDPLMVQDALSEKVHSCELAGYYQNSFEAGKPYACCIEICV
jgi:ABC-type multidrug transport system fused ATPase/permease subunit